MAKLQVEFVTAENREVSTEADFVLAPGAEGEFGVLPQHIPLLTLLATGEVVIRNDGHEERRYVSGGFIQVLPDKVTILADAAERAEDIDEQRAEEARQRAQELLAQDDTNLEAASMLENAMFQLRVADIRRRRHGERPGGAPPS